MSKPYHYTECGLQDVYLLNGFTIEHDEEYGDLLHIEGIDQLHATLARRLIDSPRPLTGGEFRYMRTFLDLSQRRLGELLGQGEQNIGNWERKPTKEISNVSADRLLRALVSEKLNEKSKLGRVIERLADMDSKEAGRLEFSRDETSHKWKAVA